jgi:hypothetical protein
MKLLVGGSLLLVALSLLCSSLIFIRKNRIDQFIKFAEINSAIFLSDEKMPEGYQKTERVIAKNKVVFHATIYKYKLFSLVGSKQEVGLVIVDKQIYEVDVDDATCSYVVWDRGGKARNHTGVWLGVNLD